MSRIFILMYHALFETDRELTELPSEDRPYAVHVSDFERHIGALVARGIRILPPAEEVGSIAAIQGTPQVLITFDDGHRSVFEYAVPTLQRFNVGGLIFATTDFIGQRRGFCGWEDLRGLAEVGFAVGAHGKTHRFFSELSSTDLLVELKEPRTRLEDCLGSEVRRLALPGGRFVRSVLDRAAEVGYRRVYGSQFGSNRLQVDWKDMPLRRIAVKRATRSEQLCALVERQFPQAVLTAGTELTKRGIRTVLGDRRYHQLYQLYRQAKP